MALTARQRAVAAALEGGLPLDPRPWRALGAPLGLSEKQVLAAVDALQRAGAIKRLGVVVRHQELGFAANAMVVWDVPDARVDAAGEWLASQAGVTLCYRRPRRPPRWPYNLFCMIHGRGRDAVLARIAALATGAPLAGAAHAVLFSTRRFKQRGARYGSGDARREAAVA